MLESKSSQFTFSAEGQILWQSKLNNPLPGVAVANLKKGAHALKPVIEVIESEATAKHDQVALKNSLNLWMNTYFSEVLEPLVLLEIPQGMVVKDDAVSQIAAKIYDGLGIIERAELEDIIAQLTPETRADLRAKKIRLGPILAFIPALNKPAAVKLRAMLWSLFNDRELPAKTPADGIVSVKIEDENPCAQYYSSIGYPLYGGRAVRIDMLDRVISCVYDHADGGKFKARHEMAEWLGCPIADLYKVLEAMGHVKTYDPAEEKAAAELLKAEQGVEDKPAAPVEAKTEEPKAEEKPEEEKKKPDVKPELATFRLKKGKAFTKKSSEGFKSKPKNSVKKKDFKKKKDAGKKPKRDNSPRVISADAKVNMDDNPFAILGQFKK